MLMFWQERQKLLLGAPMMWQGAAEVAAAVVDVLAGVATVVAEGAGDVAGSCRSCR